MELLKDELLTRLKDEGACYSVEERSQIERQLTCIAEREYEVSKSEFGSFLTEDKMLNTTVAQNDPTVLLEQALLNHAEDFGIGTEEDFGMPNVDDTHAPPHFSLSRDVSLDELSLDDKKLEAEIPKLSKQDSFDTFASAFTTTLDELNIGVDPFDLAACVPQPKNPKRRKTSHRRKSNPQREKKPAKGKEQKKEANASKTRGTHRRSKLAQTDGVKPTSISKPKRVATPPPAGRIDRAEDGRLIIRRGPRGKYTCGRCGAKKEGHVCNVKVARSVESQVDLAITQHGRFHFSSPIKILIPGTWVSRTDPSIVAPPRAIAVA